jgi:UPF0716 protein FxsA
MLGFFILLLTFCEVVTVVASIKLLGLFSTLALAVLAFLLGVAILREQGLATAERFVTRLEYGQAPVAESWDGVCLIAAAFLFMLPGLFSDVLGLMLLIPFVRHALRAAVMKSKGAQGHYWFDSKAMKRPQNDNAVIDAEWREIKNP